MNKIMRALAYTIMVLVVMFAWVHGWSWMADNVGPWAGFLGFMSPFVFFWVWMTMELKK